MVLTTQPPGVSCPSQQYACIAQAQCSEHHLCAVDFEVTALLEHMHAQACCTSSVTVLYLCFTEQVFPHKLFVATGLKHHLHNLQRTCFTSTATGAPHCTPKRSVSTSYGALYYVTRHGRAVIKTHPLLQQPAAPCMNLRQQALLMHVKTASAALWLLQARMCHDAPHRIAMLCRRASSVWRRPIAYTSTSTFGFNTLPAASSERSDMNSDQPCSILSPLDTRLLGSLPPIGSRHTNQLVDCQQTCRTPELWGDDLETMSFSEQALGRQQTK